MNKIFKYCPQCQSDKIKFKRNCFTCENCGFIYFHNTASAVAVLIRRKDEILFTIRNKEPKKNYYDTPGGFVDPGESGEHAAQREIKEELNINLSLDKLHYLTSFSNEYKYKEVIYNTLDMIFVYEDDNLEIKTFDEVELKGFLWININKIPMDKISFVSIKNALHYYLNLSDEGN